MAAPDGFIPQHALVTPLGIEPARWMLVLHGVFGSAVNWRPFVRRLVEGGAPSEARAGARPWGFVLVDLRGHGLSQGPPPPHTLAAAAADLIRLEARIELPIRGVMGHSLGGKVALAYMALRPGELERGILLDADPGADLGGERGLMARGVLALLASIPQPVPSREAFVEAVLARGYDRGVADWLAMNLRRKGEGFLLRLDLEATSALLDDHFARDLWPVVEDPRSAERLTVVLGGRSDTVSPAARSRLEGLAAGSPRLTVHVLERAGHWLHVDDPDGLLAVIRSAL